MGAAVAAFPFLREGRVVDFMAETGRWYGQYAQKVAAITAAYNEALIARAGDDLVPILVAHFMVNGVRVSHSERELHIGDAYTATAQAIPPGRNTSRSATSTPPNPCRERRCRPNTPGRCSRSTSGRRARPNGSCWSTSSPAASRPCDPCRSLAGRPLVAARGTWEELAARAGELADSYVDLTVAVGGADPELGRRAAEAFPYLVRVRAERPAAERRERHDPAQRPSDAELYAAFVRATTGADAPEDLVALFRTTLEDAVDAPA